MLVKSLGLCKQICAIGLAISRHLGENKAHINLSYSSSQSGRFLLVYSSTKNYVPLPTSSRETLWFSKSKSHSG